MSSDSIIVYALQTPFDGSWLYVLEGHGHLFDAPLDQRIMKFTTERQARKAGKSWKKCRVVSFVNGFPDSYRVVWEKNETLLDKLHKFWDNKV